MLADRIAPTLRAVQHGRLQIVSLTALAAALWAALAIGTASGAPRRLDSGIRGRAVYGPTCPVERPGRICERAYQASFTIRRKSTDKVVARVHSKADGHFTVRLRAGVYLLQPQNGKPFPRAQPQTVTVRRHHFTTVTVRFDSGIR
jgi:hypothetical protein